jgi:peptidoglycan-N-acetylglucosamine deacetylase
LQPQKRSADASSRIPPARLALFAASASVLILTMRSVAVGPPPIWFAAFAFAAYASLVVAGVLILGLRVFTNAVVRGPSDVHGVVLTFDDGPDPATTLDVLKTLDEANAKATFFVIGRKAQEHPEVVRAILGRGHAVGLHGFAHDRIFSLRGEAYVRSDLEAGLAVLTAITGTRPTLFRPPIGHTNPIIARVADSLDLTIVGWSVSGRDGLAHADPMAVATRIARGLTDGAIVLMHDAAERGDFTPAGPLALRAVLAEARQRDLAIVPLEPWVIALEEI